MNYRILIVDDEEIIRNGLISMIDWDKLGAEPAGSCPDALSALNIMTDQGADILLTDVRMPVLSGLELIDRARKINPMLQSVILSGYDDFEYARQALRAGVAEYLLKPVSRGEINRVLENVCGRIGRLHHPELLSALQSIGDVRENDMIRAVGGILDRTEESADYPSFIRQVIRYTRENFQDEGISLQKIAGEVVFMNADYLGRQFSRCMGMKYSAYLLQVRMEKAKALFIAHPEMHTYEVAEQTGFGSNTQYFSVMFKKSVGISSHEFRRQNSQKTNI